MSKLLRISFLDIKNIVRSKALIGFLIAAFSYSMLWVLLVHPKTYDLTAYNFEFGRFLYVIILYASASILRNDIKLNTTKNIFTGVFSRVEIMFSKFISLIILGLVFSTIVELNSVLVSILDYKKIGFVGYLAINHLQVFGVYTLITFLMGSSMILIVSIMFSEKKSILFYIAIFSMVNFYTAYYVTLNYKSPEMAQNFNFSAYMKTPFYATASLIEGFVSSEVIVVSIIFGIIFCLLSTLVVNTREIK